MQYWISRGAASGTWNVNAQLNGEEVVLHRGLGPADAKVAMYRMMFGLEPVDSDAAVAQTAPVHELPLAA